MLDQPSIDPSSIHAVLWTVDEDVEEAMEGKEGSLRSYRLSNYPLRACCAVNIRREGTAGPGITCILSGLLLPNLAHERGNLPDVD